MTEIMLDKKRYLHFTLNALEKYEDKTGKSVFAFDTKSMTIKDLKALVWSGLTEEMDIDLLGSLVSFENLEELTKAIEAEFTKAMPKKKEVAKVEV